MVKAIIVDDDKSVHKLIELAIESKCPQVSVIANAFGVAEGVKVINEFNPDLVFLDVRMVDGSGFDLIGHYEKPDFKVILISGFHEYASEGYKFNAIDFIVKPIQQDELIVAVNRAVDLITEDRAKESEFAQKVSSNLLDNQKIILKTIDQIYILNIGDIIHIESTRNYSTVYLEEGKKIVFSKPIKEFEELLAGKSFHRIHKSHIININKVSSYNKSEGGILMMKDGSCVPVSTRKREFLINLFNNL